YTLVGSVLMLIAILILYFNSDLRLLNAQQLSDTGVVDHRLSADEKNNAGAASKFAKEPQHTFNIFAMQVVGQRANSPFSRSEDRDPVFGQTLQWWAFLLLFIGFAIKVPAVPLHTWLPDAHVEAPTPISMILAGVLLKMGGYGIIRICYPICPDAG